MKDKIKLFSCPNCHNDLRKEGIIVKEISSQSRWVKYNLKGAYKSDEFYDGDTDEYHAICGICGAELDIKLGNIWDTLPKTKIKKKEVFSNDV